MSTRDARPDDDQMLAAVGALIFASDEPVDPKEIAQALGGVPLDQVRESLRHLGEHYDSQDVGLHLEWVAGGVRLATRPAVGAWVRGFFQQRNRSRLSIAALETLAIIAYRQPVTAPEIQAIRGKDPSAALKGLLDKKLVRCLGRKKVVGNPLLYATSKFFLMHFGLNSLNELPSIEEFDTFVGVLEEKQAALYPDAEDAPPDEDAETGAGVATAQAVAEDAEITGTEPGLDTAEAREGV